MMVTPPLLYLRNGRRNKRQREGDRRALQAALGPDGASVGLHEGLTDGQSEASASGVVLAAMPRPVEPLEDVWQFVGIDAWSIIRNCYDHCIVPPLSSDMHLALTVHRRIGDQVVEHDLDAPAVYVDQRQVIRDLHRDRDAWVIQLFDDLGYEVLHPGGHALEQEEIRFLA